MIKKFNPIWFALILGFGGIAVASVLIAKLFDVLWLNPLSFFLVYFNLVLFLFLFLSWALKAVFYSNILAEELKNPAMAGVHSLMPAATIMISINFSKIGQALSLWQYQNVSVLFWAAGAIFEFILLTLIIYSFVANGKINLSFINGGWLIPPVAALLTPVAGVKITEFISSISVAVSILWINYFFFGFGAFVFLLIAVFLFGKIIFFERLDSKVFPSFWIILVPFSLMALSLSLFANQTGCYFPEFKNAFLGLSFLANPMLIGIGLWLLVLLIFLTYYYLSKGELPYGTGWWAFVFPTASVSIAALNQADLTGQMFFAYCGLAVYLLLIAITSTVLLKTIESFLIEIGKNSASSSAWRMNCQKDT